MRHRYARAATCVVVRPVVRRFEDPEKIPAALTVGPNIYDVLAVVLPQRWKESDQESMESGNLIPLIGHGSRLWDTRKRRIDALNIDGTRQDGVTFYAIEHDTRERVASSEEQDQDNADDAEPHPTTLVSASP
jgi:hypothetical protein